MSSSRPVQVNRRRARAAVEQLTTLLPADWTVAVVRQVGDGTTVRVSDGRDEADVALAVRERVDPRDVERLPASTRPTVVSANWLSPRTRELLRARGMGYLDTTGNVEVRLSRPGLYLRTDGAQRDPAPPPTQSPSLHGPKAWALLRTLAEVTPPYTAGELAEALDLDNGYVSRALQRLADEGLVERVPRRPVTGVEWEPLLRRIVERYRLFDANDTSTWVAGGGAARAIQDLGAKRVGRWAVTGSFVGSAVAPVAAPELAVVYADDPERVASSLRLLPTVSGANVVLARPYDDIVFMRMGAHGAARSVSLAQAAIDLLTGTGRMPAEGEALLDWMRRNPQRWQASGLTG